MLLLVGLQNKPRRVVYEILPQKQKGLNLSYSLGYRSGVVVESVLYHKECLCQVSRKRFKNCDHHSIILTYCNINWF